MRSDALRSDALRSDVLGLTVRGYRVMAYVTGVVLIVLCFVGIPLQVFAHNLVVVKYVGTAHGFLYIVYILVAFAMTRLVGMKWPAPARSSCCWPGPSRC